MCLLQIAHMIYCLVIMNQVIVLTAEVAVAEVSANLPNHASFQKAPPNIIVITNIANLPENKINSNTNYNPNISFSQIEIYNSIIHLLWNILKKHSLFQHHPWVAIALHYCFRYLARIILKNQFAFFNIDRGVHMEHKFNKSICFNTNHIYLI